ncbi:MAG TPA: PASTA domain-containing protein [Terriglobales bacterium]|nr:PASTA domain-containing protein [Terriglobales bacterium]
MRQFFRMLLLALVLLTVALISAVTAMQFAIHGREVAIPKLVGMSLPEAERALTDSGLQVVVERQFYSSDIAEGRIMTQVPVPGVKVRRGWAIRVAQSLGPQRVPIPDVTNESQRVAELTVRRRGLEIGSVAQLNLSEAPAGQVVSQSPPANASRVSLPKINLLVSDGAETEAYVMPSFIGQPLGRVTLALQEAGLKVGKVTVAPPAPPEGQPSPAPAETTAQPGAASMIVSQSVAPGRKITAGSAVDFEVR